MAVPDSAAAGALTASTTKSAKGAAIRIGVGAEVLLARVSGSTTAFRASARTIQIQRAVELQRQRDLRARRVARVHGQRAGVLHADAGAIVGVAELGVRREHEPVDPGPGGRGAALVGDRPGHGHRVAAARARGRHRRARDEIRVGGQDRGDGEARGVVGLAGAGGVDLDHAAGARRVLIGGDLDQQRSDARAAVRQAEGEAAREPTRPAHSVQRADRTAAAGRAAPAPVVWLTTRTRSIPTAGDARGSGVRVAPRSA